MFSEEVVDGREMESSSSVFRLFVLRPSKSKSKSIAVTFGTLDGRQFVAWDSTLEKLPAARPQSTRLAQAPSWHGTT